VQGLLVACCVGVFALKRKKEEQKFGDDARTRAEFALDASKQFAAAGWLHILNLGFATGLNNMMSGGDECEWYWINILVDTTLGTAVSYVFLQIANAFIRKRLHPEVVADFRSGHYKAEDGQIQMSKYGKQLALWLLVVSSMKMTMVLFMFLFSGPLLAFAGVMLAPFLAQPWLKLLVVMIMFPLLMDGFQIWMVDNFLKKPEPSFNTGAEDPEMQPEHIEAAADALLAFSHKCEEAAEEALPSFKVWCHEALHHAQAYEDLPEQKSAASGSTNFDTKYKGMEFKTIIPPDQAHDSD